MCPLCDYNCAFCLIVYLDSVAEDVSKRDYSILEMASPHGFLGRNLKDLELRQRFGLSVLAIRRKDRIIVSPNAEQLVEEGDILVVLGQPDKLAPLNEGLATFVKSSIYPSCDRPRERRS